jgi:hypothetical protein
MARSTTQNGSIVYDSSLVLYLDAANPDSYPGSGATWTDLTINKNNFTLSGTPTYTGIYFNFNTSQAASCINTTCGNFGSGSFTIEYITQYTASGGSGDVIAVKRGNTLAPGIAGSPGWCFRNGATAWWVQDNNPGGTTNNFTNVVGNLGAPPKASSLVHMAYTVEKNGTSTTGSTYTNGVLTSIDRKTFIGTNLTDNNSAMVIASSFTGSIACVRLYTKKLTQDEVTQNFNALKGRFGL